MRMRWVRSEWAKPHKRYVLETLAGGMLASCGSEPGEPAWAYLGERGGHVTVPCASFGEAEQRVRAVWGAPAIGGES